MNNMEVSAFPIWQTLHTSINALCSHLENIRSLQIFEKFFFKKNKEKDYTEILIPSYNESLSFEKNMFVEKQYEAFTSWFLGRFFYLMCTQNEEDIEQLLIKIQLKILTTLYLYHKKFFNSMVKKYNDALTDINKHLYSLMKQKINEKTVCIIPFKTDPIIINDEILELESLRITLKSRTTSYLLQYKIVKIITCITMKNETCFWLDTTAVSLLENIIVCLKDSNYRTKITIFKYFIEMIDRNHFQINKSSIFRTHYKELICYIEKFVYDLKIKKFEVLYVYKNTFKRIIDIINEIDIISHDHFTRKAFENICQYFISHKLTKINLSEDTELMLSVVMLYQKILLINNKPYLEINLLFSRIKKAVKCKVLQILFQYQIYHEIKHEIETVSIINVYDKSNTWMKMFESIISKTDLVYDNANDFLLYIKNVLTVAEIVHYLCTKDSKSVETEFFQLEQFLNKIKTIINTYNLTENETSIDYIVDIFSSIITVTNFTHANYEHFKFMVSFICYPFANIQGLINIKRFFPNNFSKESYERKQRKALKILINCFVQEPFSEKPYTNDIHIAIIEVFKHCTVSKNINILLEICNQLLYIVHIIKDAHLFINDILRHLLISKNEQVLKLLSQKIGIIICVLCNEYIITNNLVNNSIVYEGSCIQCDFNTSENKFEETLTRCSDNTSFNRSQFFLQKNSTSLDCSLFQNLLNSNDSEVKINFIKQLPRCLKHNKDFCSLNTTNMWLKYIEDKDKNVQSTFISFISTILNSCQDNESQLLMIDKCLKITVRLIKDNIGDTTFLEMILKMIEEIGCFNHPNVLYTTTKLLIIFIILTNNRLSYSAIKVLGKITEWHDVTASYIFIKFKRNLCQIIVDTSVYGYLSKKYTIVRSLRRISLAFDYNLDDFVSRYGHHLLSYYVPYFVKEPKSSKMLTDIANGVYLEASDLVVSNFSYIYTYIYLNEDNEMFKKCMQYIANITRNNTNTLKNKSKRLILIELLLNFNDKSELVIEELYRLALDEVDSKSKKILSTNSEKMQQISELLQPRFLGILVYIDTKLISKSVDDPIKVQILESLPHIIKIMGPKYITSLRHKILATLRTISNVIEDVNMNLVCKSWDIFIHCCELDSLGPLLSTIFISLLPLLDSCFDKVNLIFKYLIQENYSTLKDYVEDLFFLYDTNVSEDLKTIVRNYFHSKGDKSKFENLTFLLKNINHETIEIRLYGLKFLEYYLNKEREELQELILGNNGMHFLLNKIVDTLIEGFKEKDEQYRLHCGKCIGALGAIEPSHFPRKYTQSSEKFPCFITDDIFVINALTELLRSFKMEKDTHKMNRFALAIQEILKEYKISPDESAEKHYLWKQFTEDLRELMLPFLSSRYSVKVHYEDNVETHPIFGSSLGATFQDWLNNWTAYLISISTNDKRSLLEVCKPCLKHDYRILMMFLPLIITHAIFECSDEQRQIIFNEFMTVLNTSQHITLDSDPKTEECSKSNATIPNESDKNNSIKIIFVLLDYIDRWLKEFECNQKNNELKGNKHYQTVSNFFSQLCSLTIAQCNFSRGEYPRALMYLEKYVGRDKNKLNEHLGFFLRIYSKLEESDGVAGTMAIKQKDPSIEEQILAHNISGQLQDAAACYERMAQEQPLSPQYLQDMVKCYLELDNPFTALNIASTAMERYNTYKDILYELQAEPLWRLSMYDELEELLSKPELKNNDSWGVKLGQTLLHFRNGERYNFTNEIDRMRSSLIGLLGITSIEDGIYRQGYSHIIKLHILNEIQKAEQIIYKIKDTSDVSVNEELIDNLIKEWNFRLQVVQNSVRVVEPILRLRRIILEQSLFVLGEQGEQLRPTINKYIAKYWLKSAEIARRSNIFQQTYMYILKAEQYKPMELFIEKAKFYWAKEAQEHAFNTLKRGLEEFFPDSDTFKDMEPDVKKYERKLCAEAKLLIAKYNHETANVGMDINIANYKEAVDMYREWEKSQMSLAQYYDRVFLTMEDNEKDDRGGEVQVHIINSFGKSLLYGSNYIYQSMPRMLSIWLDFGTRIVKSRVEDECSLHESKKNTLYKMIKLIEFYVERLPAFIFFSAFSQLVSRICHPVREVYIVIKSILIKLILKYPQQSMWMILSVSKSAYTMRTKRCQEVLQDQRLKNSKTIKLIFDVNRLAEKLIELCNKSMSENILKGSINSMIRSLPRLLDNKDFSQIMMPMQRLRKLILPNPDQNSVNHNPFPNTLIYITGIEDEVDILQSLQRPKKITLRGSDGKKYIYMLKPNDDLRKDFKVMEFCNVVNLFLHQEPDSRERRLSIRTYSVVPLNEECGLIEWINNLVGLRPILVGIYKQRGIFVSARELKAIICNNREPLTRHRDIFETKLLPRHPPVLGEWFRRRFPDAHRWYRAKTAYIRTSAVLSMVGYVLGLGDRHGENILFDYTNGDTVHVDFNCLFNKGETFDWPERVPFRLTHNMVEAMGPLGVEGIFRKTSAVTLRVLRYNTDTLMSIVRPFVYDPLVSWPRNQLMKNELIDGERTNEQALEHIKNISLRLRGMIKNRGNAFSISLSCEGQANHLIADATNINNLCQMYVGWGPFL